MSDFYVDISFFATKVCEETEEYRSKTAIT